MQRHRFTLVLAVAAAGTALLFSTAAARAQSSSQSTASAPVPPAIAAAKTIFLSNAGADSNLFAGSYMDPVDDGPYSGDPSRGYDEFYADLAKSGRFQIVGSPSTADLVVELSLTAHTASSRDVSFYLPSFRLVIRDRRSHYILWTLTQTIETALRQKTADHNFDTAVHELSQQFLQLAGPAPAGPATTP